MSNTEDLAQRFPKEFIFGCATASYQIEGAIAEDGRKPSIWDTFSETPGKVINGDTGKVACDHYHRWESDLDLLSELGVDGYRMSIAWPRVVPDGFGATNSAGLDFYERLIDGCLARNIKPFITLYHWDLPQRLEDNGGWRNRDTSNAFADYTDVVMNRLADRIEAVSTLNEPWCSAHNGHLYGVHAPGLTDRSAWARASHHLNLAHGLGVKVVRDHRASLPVGCVFNPASIYPGSDAVADLEAAARQFEFDNGIFFGPVFAGKYSEMLVGEVGDLLPEGWQEDLDTIHQPNDFVGINYYTPLHVTDAPEQPFPAARPQRRPEFKRTDIGWPIHAPALSHLMSELTARYKLPPIYIMENGCCDNTPVGDGVVEDDMRLSYMISHIAEVAAMVEEGLDIKGYFAWSMMDNFEWAEGYKMRFGLVHVDYDTQVRTIKQSGHWYKDLLKARG